MPRFIYMIMGFGLLFSAVEPVESQELLPESDLSYADIADLALGAPIVATARVDRARRLDEERALGVAPNHLSLPVKSISSIMVLGDSPKSTRSLGFFD